MKKRKVISLVAAVTVVAALGIGATLAYFTDQALEDMVHNSLIVTSQYFKTMKEQP